MSITPQTARPALSTANVLIGAPVGADQWQRAGALCNWLAARGAVLVPWCAPGASIATSRTFRFYVQPRRAAIERRWSLEIYNSSSSITTVTLRAPAASGTIASITAPPGRSVHSYIEAIAASSGASQEISIAVEDTVEKVAVLAGLSCIEIDRASLEQSTTDYAVDISTCAAGRPMFDPPAASGQSLGGVVEALEYVDTRRAGIVHITVGSVGASRTSATPAAVTALGVPVLAAKELRSDTTGVVMWTAYARMASAGTGKITVTTTSGVNDNAEVTTTSFAWTTPRAISIDCEDLATDDGRQGGVFDDLTASVAGSGAVAIEWQTISVYVDRAQSLIGGA